MTVRIKPIPFGTYPDGTEPEVDDAAIKRYEALRNDEGDEWVDERIAKIKEAALEGEDEASSLAAIANAAKVNKFLSEAASASGVAVVNHIISELNKKPKPLTAEEEKLTGTKELFNEWDKGVVLARNASGWSWPRFQNACHDGTAEKMGKPLIDVNYFAAIQNRIDINKKAAAERAATAAAKNDPK